MTEIQKYIIARIDERMSRLEKEKQDFLLKYENEKKVLDSDKERIMRASVYDKKDIFPVIAYLVSLIEEKEYFFRERVLPISTDFNRVTDKDYVSDDAKYKLCYLCCDENAANKEIDARINEVFKAKYEESLKVLSDILLTPASNYIQLTYYYYKTTIEFRRPDNREWCDDYRDIESKICDENFLYIIDFMEYLTDERLKKADLALTSEEMMDYALRYAAEYKKNKEHGLKRVRENN